MPSPSQELPCPQCGSQMLFRLGEYECAQCGHRQSAVQPKEERASSGPGFRKEQWGGGSSSASSYGGGYSPQGQPRGGSPVSAPPPPGSGLYNYASNYSSVETVSYPDSLQTEKYVYFGIHVVSSLFLAASVIFAIVALNTMDASVSSQANTPEMFLAVPILIGMIIFAILLKIGLLWFVLFSDQTWAKWTCSGCTILGLLISTGYLAGSIAMANGILLTLGFLADIAIGIWFLTIMRRDIQRLQSYS